MSKKRYLAIDGGGTKTEYLLLDEEFRPAGRYLGGCVNHDLLSGDWKGSERELRTGILGLLKDSSLEIGDVADVVAGLSGVDNRADQIQAEQCLRAMGLKRFLVCNDGFLPVKGECPGWGIAYNCGTGVCCAGISPAGKMEKAAGLDEWSGDAGGGRWISIHVFRKVYENLVLRERETHMTLSYKNRFSLKTEEDLIDFLAVLKDSAGHPEISREAVKLFFEELEAGDPDAEELARQMARCGADNIGRVCRKLGFAQGEIPVVLTGSVHTKAASRKYLEFLEREAGKDAPGTLHIFTASREPVEGAVKWLRERAGEI